MIFCETGINGAFTIEIEKITDNRGFFARKWCKKEFETKGLNTHFVQANMSYNKKNGTIRGMHYQVAPCEEVKIIRCTKGAIYDVIIDLRLHSSTYKKWIGVELTEDNYRMLYVPEGFAHGFQTLTDDTQVFYQVSQYYSPECEKGVRWDDPAFKIEWPETKERIISDKDQMWSDYKE
ncbi:MAG: dTDP-4-dehydrorhamnose 3,5-epimerase [Planctomycetota bacterium]|jgi:dTDP-4-dehydrorhamnose 3,5-epimerase